MNKQPYELTRKEFLSHHYTGQIPSHAYDDYKTVQGLSWITKSHYPELYSTKQFNGKTIEFRKSGGKLNYTKYDDNEEIIRDLDGMALMMSDDEIKNKNLKTHNQTIAAFDGNDAIGLVSDEFGTTGVWVVEDYQKIGIGSYLLFEFQKNFGDRKIGQMTNAGINMTIAYHRNLVIDAIKNGKKVPDNVLNEYSNDTKVQDAIKLYKSSNNWYGRYVLSNIH